MLRAIADRARSSWRFRWEGLTAAWICGLAAVAAMAFVPNVYDVETSIAVDPASLDELSKALHPGERQHSTPLKQLRAILLHPSQLEKVDDALGTQEYSVARRGHGFTLQRFQSELIVSKIDAEQSAFRIALRDRYHRRPLQVLDASLRVLQDSLSPSDAENQAATVQVSDTQLTEVEARLDAAETALAEFERSHPDLASDAEAGEAASLGAAREALRVLEQRQRNARNRLSDLEQRLRDAQVTRAAAGSLDQRIMDLESQLDRLRQDLHGTHPDVVVARKSLERLHAQRERELVEIGLTPYEARSLPLGASSAYRDLLQDIGSTRGLLARIDNDVAQESKRVAALSAAHDNASGLRAELADLRRNAAAARAEYALLLANFEAADLAASRLETRELTVIASPSVTAVPVAPRRPLWLLGIVAGSLAFGCFVAVMLSTLRPVFYDGKRIQMATGLPLVGLITHAWRAQLRSRFHCQLAAFTACATVFLAVIGFVFAFQYQAAVL